MHARRRTHNNTTHSPHKSSYMSASRPFTQQGQAHKPGFVTVSLKTRLFVRFMLRRERERRLPNDRRVNNTSTPFPQTFRGGPSRRRLSYSHLQTQRGRGRSTARTKKGVCACVKVNNQEPKTNAEPKRRCWMWLCKCNHGLGWTYVREFWATPASIIQTRGFV